MNEEKKVISLKISKAKFEALDKYCKFKGISKHDYLEPIVSPYLDVLIRVDGSKPKEELKNG